MSLEDKLVAYRELCRQIQRLEEEKKALSALILQEMPNKKMAFADCIARVYTRLSIRIPMEQARMFDATKMVEQVDRAKIKEIYKSGVPLEGVSEMSYLMISSAQSPTPEEIPTD